MDESEILAVMDRAEARLGGEQGLEGSGFWRAIDYLRSNPEAARCWAGRAARIDRMAFEQRVKLRVPEVVGTSILAFGKVAAVLAIVVSASIDDSTIRTLVFLAAVVALLITTHSLTHWVFGRLMGIRFTHYFIGGPPPPRPGVKVDYESYLQTTPRRRALMHASGAVVTKIIPFLMLPVASILRAERWAFYALAIAGVGQIATDLLFSTKTSDWKKVKRELRAARSTSLGGSGG